jgi:GNAT superfamily N-acetyltransferase
VPLDVIDLTAAPADLEQLDRFYSELYIAGFPDPDERESLANMRRYLELREQGWYGRNNYHILLGFADGRCRAAAVIDYLAEPNAGIIEFLLIDAARRGQGLGFTMHRHVEQVLQADARRAGYSDLQSIVIEMNDPYQVDAAADNMDPFARAELWGRWGYAVLGFPYVQPALSDEQGPVTYLLLCAKPLDPAVQCAFPPTTVRQIVYGYLKWAMRIEDPEADPTFQEMSRALERLPSIPLTSLQTYVGRDPQRPFEIVPVTDPASPEFAELMRVFAASFPGGATAIHVDGFGRTLQRSRSGECTARYHLWGVRDPQSQQIAGLASFFTTTRCGFGGYLALTPPLRGTGRCGLLVARIEEQMIRDQPGVPGWYIECAKGADVVPVFEHLGFRPLAGRYLQPPLTAFDLTVPAGVCGPELQLLYKPLGSRHRAMNRTADEVLDDVREILRSVYNIREPDLTETLREWRATAVD